MIHWIFEKVVTYFQNEFDVASVFIGIVVVLFSKVIGEICKKIKLIWESRLHFSISGIWVCKFHSFVYNNREILELYYIKQSGDQLNLYIQHYSRRENDEGNIYESSKLHGHGIVRGHHISMCYTTDKKESETCGVAFFTLKETNANEYALCGNVYEAYSALNKTQKVNLLKRMAKEDILKLEKLTFCKKSKAFLIKFKLFFGIYVYENYDVALRDN